MNVSELTANLYGTNFNSTHSVSSANSALRSNAVTASSVSGSQALNPFASILSNYVTNNTVNAASDFADSIKELGSTDDENQKANQQNSTSIDASISSLSLDADAILEAVISGKLSTSDLDDDMMEQLNNLSQSLSSLNNSDDNDPNVMSILTDADKAKEYLSSQSGRQLILDMAKNEIAGIITGSNS